MTASSTHNTAILVFACSANEEAKHKKIRKGRHLFNVLTQHTLKIVKKTNIPFFHCTEAQQEGLFFGERFSNAIQNVFDKGYQRIITVGNDSPHLTHVHIEKAIIALNEQKIVLGPSSDGGFYLMGLHRKDFNKQAFENLSWQTSRIRNEVVELFSPDGDVTFQLPLLFDIDSRTDVLLISKSRTGLSQCILEAIVLSLFENKKIEYQERTPTLRLYQQIPYNKGSPQYSFS